MDEWKIIAGIRESINNGYKEVCLYEHEDNLRITEGCLMLQGYYTFDKKVAWMDSDGKPIYLIIVNLI